MAFDEKTVVNKVTVRGDRNGLEIEAPSLFELLNSMFIELKKTNAYLAALVDDEINDVDVN
jgi:hypothetical protein